MYEYDTRHRSDLGNGKRSNALLHFPLPKSDVFKRTKSFAGVLELKYICGQQFDTRCLIFSFKKKCKKILDFPGETEYSMPNLYQLGKTIWMGDRIKNRFEMNF